MSARCDRDLELVLRVTLGGGTQPREAHVAEVAGEAWGAQAVRFGPSASLRGQELHFKYGGLPRMGAEVGTVAPTS